MSELFQFCAGYVWFCLKEYALVEDLLNSSFIYDQFILYNFFSCQYHFVDKM